MPDHPPGPDSGSPSVEPAPPPLRVVVSILFFLTGGAALAYELVWVRWLELLLGTSTHAATAVLAAFMGGLALGGALFGRIADRVRDRLGLYGWLELAVGAYGLAFPSLLAAATGAYLEAARALEAGPAGMFLLRFLLAFGLVLVPTTLMGGTLPVLVRHLASREQVGGGVAWLYFVNSAGAAIGCGVAGFLLVGRFGLLFTSTVAVLLNLAAGLAALVLRRLRRPAPEAPPAPALPAGPSEGLSPWRIGAAAVLSGAAAMAYEIGWFRMLALVLGSSANAFTLMLATFIGGLAAGSLWAVPRIDRWASPAAALRRIQVAVALLAVATLPLSGALPSLSLRLRALSLGSYGLYQAMQLLLCALLMAAPTFLLGAGFPLLARIAAGAGEAGLAPSRLGRRVGGVVAWTTAGNIAGTLLAGLAGIPWVGVRGTLTLAAGASLLAAAAVDPLRPPPVRQLARAGMPAALAAVVAFGIPGWDLAALTGAPFRVHDLSGPSLRRFHQVNQRRKILLLREDAGATVTVEERDDNRVLRVNGKPDASLEAQDMLTQHLLAHYPLLVHPDPRGVMVVGLGSGITVGAVLQHPVERVRVAEISRGVVEAARLFEEANHAFWTDPRVEIRVEDARNVLLVSRDLYDVVISEPSNLWMAGVASLYTQEFYRLARSRLRPGGLLVQWLHGYEMTESDLRLVLRTLLTVFPHVTAFRSAPGDLEILASPDPFDWNFGRMEERMARPGVWEDLESLEIQDLYTLLTNQEIPEQEVEGYAAAGTPDRSEWVVHLDDWPLLERSTPRAFFENAAVVLPEAELRVGSPHILLRRYLEGRAPTPQERFHFAAYSVRLGIRNNLVVGALEAALQDEPGHRPAMRLLAEVLADRGRHEEAASWMERAAALEPVDPEDLHRLALHRLEVARRRIGFLIPFDPRPALEAMARCVALAPDREDYRRTYAAMLAEAGQEEKARWLQTATASPPPTAGG